MSELPPYQQEVFNLFASEWSRDRERNNGLDPLRTAQILTFSISRAVEPPPRTYLWSSILAMHQFATLKPQAIDFLISVLAEVGKLLPKSVSNEYGEGPEAVFEALRWWIIDEANCFNSVEPPRPTGTLDPQDKSNLLFKGEEIELDLEAVLHRVQEWQAERMKIIISMAIASRCFALNIVRESNGEQIAGLVSNSLQRGARWTEADYIASSILLRGCAKSLLGVLPCSQDLFKQWKIGFKQFLLYDEQTRDNSFAVKHHTALVLKNLETGPVDEDAAELFLYKEWIF